MVLNLLPIEPFDAEGNPNNTGSRWTKWLSNFELFIMTSNITDEKSEACNAFVLCKKTCARDPQYNQHYIAITATVILFRNSQHISHQL